MIHGGTFPTLPRAWITILRQIHAYGETNRTEYGTNSRFLNGVAAEITDYREEWHPRDPYCSKNRLAEYKKQFKRGYTHSFDYTYMDRLTCYPCPAFHVMVSSSSDATSSANDYSAVPDISYIDQLEKVRELLASGEKYESKRVQMITWQPWEDMESEHPPCLQRIWLYPYPNNIVDVHIHYRSWDWFQAAEANIIAIMDMLKTEILEPCRLKTGTVRLFGDNVHYYMDVEDIVEKTLE